MKQKFRPHYTSTAAEQPRK